MINNKSQLVFRIPFIFSKEVNPKQTYTVGDQLLAEHLYPFLANSSTTNGLNSIFADIEIDRSKNTVIINLKETVVTNDGLEITTKQVCENLLDSFKGTQHSNYNIFLKDIKCEDRKISISFIHIPYNITELLSSSDYSITIKDEKEIKFLQAGPYYLDSLTPTKAVLNCNKNYPKHLRANNVPQVIYEAYQAQNTALEVQEIIKNNIVDGAYIYGHTIKKSELEQLEKSNYRVNVSGTEWLIYIGFTEKVDQDDRIIISDIIDQHRPLFENTANIGIPAYSIQPADRPFGINAKEYFSHKPQKTSLNKTLSRNLVVGTLDEWANIPLFKQIIETLCENKQIKLKTFTREKMDSLYSSVNVDFFITPFGISPADPLINYMIFHRYDKIFQSLIDKDTIRNIAKSENMESLIKIAKQLEFDILSKRLALPILHFPGITIEKKNIGQNRDIEWGWGIHAWTYQSI